MDCDAALFVRTLNDHTADTCLLAFFANEFPNFQVFQQKIAIVFGICIPTAIPSTVDLKTHTDWIDFMSHYACSSTWRTKIVSSENGLTILPKRPRARGRPRFMVKFLPT